MNTRGPFRKRYTLNFTNVGNGAFATQNVTPLMLSGKLIEVTAGKTGGSGTQVQMQVKENGARMMFDSGQLGNFPQAKTELSRSFELAGGQNLQVGVKVDAGNDTNIAVDIVVES